MRVMYITVPQVSPVAIISDPAGVVILSIDNAFKNNPTEAELSIITERGELKHAANKLPGRQAPISLLLDIKLVTFVVSLVLFLCPP